MRKITQPGEGHKEFGDYNEAATFMQDLAAVNRYNKLIREGKLKNEPEGLADLKAKLRAKVKSLGGIERVDHWVKACAPDIGTIMADLTAEDLSWLED